jgi:NMD protein affecting ribosome stability and mRNA decay
MITCRCCGANCDPADLRQGLCDDCRSAEPEVRMIPAVTDRRRQRVYEEMERNGVAWQVYTA